jgi:hypothetical protein
LHKPLNVSSLDIKGNLQDSARSLRFASREIHVGFVVDKVALGQVFSEFIGFPCLRNSTVAPYSLYNPERWTKIL